MLCETAIILTQLRHEQPTDQRITSSALSDDQTMTSNKAIASVHHRLPLWAISTIGCTSTSSVCAVLCDTIESGFGHHCVDFESFSLQKKNKERHLTFKFTDFLSELVVSRVRFCRPHFMFLMASLSPLALSVLMETTR